MKEEQKFIWQVNLQIKDGIMKNVCMEMICMGMKSQWMMYGITWKNVKK